jgi:DHA1 family bicyclomycin/chloramphenicol resistance-like MFS transporter
MTYRKSKMVYLVFYILVVQMFAMFSTDMYIPALPGMAESLGTTEQLVNLTIALFFTFMMVGTLIFGPLSDKLGRRPLLIGGSGVFVVASAGCALVPTIELLLVARAVQALGASMAQVVGTAIVKDLFAGKTRENVLIATQALFVLGPMMAPFVGGQVLLFANWRFIFLLLAGFGILAFVLSCFFKESLPQDQRHQGSLAASLLGLVEVARSRTFVLFMLATMLFAALPFNTYLMGSAHIYESYFGLTAQEYGLVFGANALVSTFGLAVLKLMERFMSLRTLSVVLLGVSGVAGACMMVLGASQLAIFFATMLAFNTTCVMVRPYSVNILLEMRTRDIGSASAFMGFSYAALGVTGMLPVLLVGGDYIVSLGALIFMGALISITCLILVLRGKETIPSIKE